MYEGMFTDKQRMQLAREEFNDMNYMVNRDVTIGEGASKTYVGTVDSFVRGRTGVNGDRDSGLDALVVKDELRSLAYHRSIPSYFILMVLNSYCWT